MSENNGRKNSVGAGLKASIQRLEPAIANESGETRELANPTTSSDAKILADTPALETELSKRKSISRNDD
jgi:hypothetical protein